MMKPFLPALATLLITAACAVAPTPPTVTAGQVDRAFDTAERLSELPLTAPSQLPVGNVTYDGQIGADVSGDAAGSILADMTMIVGFSSDRVSGSVTNINLIDPNGSPNQRFDGSLAIDGIEAQGALGAVATGQISGVDGDGYAVDADMSLDLVGAVVDDRGRGDAIFGAATGAADGDFSMDVDGVFFGTAR